MFKLQCLRAYKGEMWHVLLSYSNKVLHTIRTILQPSHIKQSSTNHVLWQLMQATILYVGEYMPAVLLKFLCATDGSICLLLGTQLLRWSLESDADASPKRTLTLWTWHCDKGSHGHTVGGRRLLKGLLIRCWISHKATGKHSMI